MKRKSAPSAPEEFKLRRRWLAHPAVVFLGVWLLAMSLAAWGWIPAFAEYAPTAVLLGAILIAAVLTGTLVATPLAPVPRRVHSSFLRYGWQDWILALWALITLVEIAVAGGLPILWLVTGSGRTYEDFGVPTVHGFANAMWLFLAFTYCIKFFDPSRSRRDVVVAVLLTAWPVLVVSRALFTILLLQLIFFYLFTTKRPMLSIATRLSALAVVFSLAFGFAGDVRAPEFSIVESLGFDADQIRFAAFLWIYSYIVSPIATLALNWDSTVPAMNLLPSNTLANLLPSVVKAALGMETGFDGYLGSLAHGAFNVSTAFLAPFLDWGVAGMLLMAFLIGFFGHIAWRAALRNALNLPLLCAFDAFVALTIFTNQFTQLTPLLLLMLLAFLARRPLRRSAGATTPPYLRTTLS